MGIGGFDIERQELIALLNEDLASELAAMVTYIAFAARVDGPYPPRLSGFFSAEVSGEQEHAVYLANKYCRARRRADHAANRGVAPEGQSGDAGVCPGNMERAAARYVVRARQAEEFGDIGLKLSLEDFIRDESAHVEETEAILRHWGDD